MTIDEFILKQRERINKIREQALRVAAFDTHTKMANRIFIEGEAANESLIGSYNTSKPLYVNPRKSPRAFPTGGKTGNRRNIVGQTTPTGKQKKQAHKTAFFYSYRDFKQAIGQPTDKVRLNLFGRMQSDFVTGIRRVSNTEYVVSFKDKKNLLKARGQERHFNKIIFKLGQYEINNFNRVLRLEVNRILYGK